ncbi:MAG: hypothetical protein JF604_23740 [Bradyrhizobium sp.]|jgi:hypothetical protein|nr:hypothetical protein [Bradyrhizobium sp.]
MIVAVSAANTLLAVRAFADMVRYVIFIPLFPPVLYGAALRAPIALSRRPKKGGSVTRDTGLISRIPQPDKAL